MKKGFLTVLSVMLLTGCAGAPDERYNMVIDNDIYYEKYVNDMTYPRVIYPNPDVEKDVATYRQMMKTYDNRLTRKDYEDLAVSRHGKFDDLHFVYDYSVVEGPIP